MAKTFEERFLDKLRELSVGVVGGVKNGVMKQNLGWQPERYESVKQSLIYKKSIRLGKGAGGKVMLPLPAEAKKKALRGFISYSHADDLIKGELVKHLKPLERKGLVESWHDGKINAGQNLHKEIIDNLEKADIVILLVSVDFINSTFCNEIELKRAMERNDEGSAVVVPVIARKCLWHDEIFGGLKATPKDGHSISASDRDSALTEVVESIRELALAHLAKV